MNFFPLKLAVGYGLDLLLGDPRWLPHPVRGIGWAIQKGEGLLRKWLRNEILAGWLLVLTIGLGCWGVVQGLLFLGSSLWPRAAGWVEVLFVYICLSTRDLAKESWPVHDALAKKDLPLAREKVHWIVGRDTQELDEPEVVRATAETIAESIMDGIVAPLFYAVLGGAAWMFVYKGINTLDSMIGYRSLRYIHFGRAAAKVDSWMNVVPAHLTAGLIAAASGLCGGSAVGAIKAAYRDGAPTGENSLITEAAMAGGLGVRLGGKNFYQGKPFEVPLLGEPKRALEPSIIAQSIRVMWVASLLAIVTALIARWLLWGKHP